MAAVAIKGECASELEKHVDSIYWTGIGKLGKWIEIFQKEGVSNAVMCGGIQKTKMYPNILRHLPDTRTLKFWFSQYSRYDHDLLGALAEEFTKEGIEIRSSILYCPQLLAPQGTLTNTEPTERQWNDIFSGWSMIKQIAAMQIGQSITLKDGAVIAVEGVDGTDATLRRAGELAGDGVVAVKVAKHNHDPRFDIPCIGPDTINVLKSISAAALAVEAEATLLLEKEETVKLADKAGISIVSLKNEDVDFYESDRGKIQKNRT